MSETKDFDYLCDLLAFAGSLSRQESFVELREAACQLDADSPLRSWFLHEMAQLLGVPSVPPRADARPEVRA